MNWRHVVVLVVAVLALSAQPVAAQNASAVASEHTTFGTGSAGEPSPTQLTNTTIVGSGDDSNVVLTGPGSVDGFEDGDIAEYGGETGAFSVTQQSAMTGVFGLEGVSSSGSKAIARTDTTLSEGNLYRVLFKPRVSDDNSGIIFFAQDASTEPGGYFVRASARNNEFELYRQSTSGGFTLLNSTAATISADSQYEIQFKKTAADAITVSVVDSSGSQLAKLTATDSTFNSGGIGYRVAVGAADFDAPIIKSEGAYVGAAHDAEQIGRGYTNLTLSNASATVTWQEDGDNDGAWTNVTSTTYSTTGNVTADLSGVTSDRWRVRIRFDAANTDAIAKLHDEGVLFPSSSPTLSDAEPPDQAKIENAVGNVSINVSDADFPLTQGDNVTVSASDDDGNSLGSTTLTSNGTASLAYSSEAGENVIEWTATDAYGATDTYTQSFETPGVIKVRNESSPGQIISTPSNITATFYGGDGATVIEKTSDDGTIPIAGVPTDAEYVVAINAVGYRPRRVALTNLFEQRSVYLLPESAEAANVQFELNDRTGDFPSASELIISKPITRNNSTEYVAIAADSFGATGSTRFILEDNSRYVLRVESPDGAVRDLGAYTTSGAAVEPLPIGRVSVGSTIDSGSAIQTGYVTEDGQTYLRLTYADPENRTESLSYTVTNETGAVIEPERSVEVDGEYRATIPVAESGSATVNYSYTRQTDGGLVTKSGNASVGGVPGIAKTWPIDRQVLSLSGYILIVGVTGLLVIRDPGVASIVGTVVASLLTFIGVVQIPYMALGVAGVTAVFYNVGRR